MQQKNYFTKARIQLASTHQKELEANLLAFPIPDKFYVWQEDELKACILAAQAYDQAAIDKLCACFEPLILKAVNLTTTEAHLNYNDTLHYAWEYFLEAIMKYQSQNYNTFPGYVLLRLYSRLQRLRYNDDRQTSNEAVSIDEESAQELAGPDNVNQFIDSNSLASVLDIISPRQKEILQQRYFQRRRTADIAKDMRLSESRVRHIKQDALNALNNLLS